MTQLYERRLVRCPYAQARQYLRNTIEQARGRAHPQLLNLRYNFPKSLAALEKAVVVQYDAAIDPMHFDEPWRVRWQPEGGGPYPSFDGELTVRADEDYRRAVIELRGEYAPPLGTVGAAFDLAVGSRIASGTARDLLERIAATMEAQHAADEAQKRKVETV